MVVFLANLFLFRSYPNPTGAQIGNCKKKLFDKRVLLPVLLASVLLTSLLSRNAAARPSAERKAMEAILIHFSLQMS